MHGLRLQPQAKIGMNEMDDAMITDMTSPEPPYLPTPIVDNDDLEATLRTLSTATRCRTVWTPGLILRRILERDRAGLSLKAAAVQRDSANLSNAARRHFGSWDHAVMKARKTGAGRMVIHTRDTIIARLREQAAAGLTVSCKHPFLRSCRKPAIRLFGSWVAALVAAGVKSAKHGPKSKAAGKPIDSWKGVRQAAETPFNGIRDYTRERILEILRERGRAGKSVSSCHPDMQPYLRLVKRLFGSWTKAREDAGCGRPKPFTKDEVLAVLVRVFDGDRIPHMRDPDLRPYVSAACRIFGKWREAVRQAEEQWSKRMPKASPCEPGGIGERQSKGGEAKTCLWVIEEIGYDGNVPEVQPQDNGKLRRELPVCQP